MIPDKRIAIEILLVLLFCVFVSGDAKVRCIEREREALLSFKNGLIDDLDFLSSWHSDECCKWDGVVCRNTTGHVIALRLDGVGLRGKIGSSLVELHHLNSLDLSRNDFGGIPIPEFIGSMKHLQHLFLSDSNFSGIVPPQLGNLTNLRSLDLSSNDFGGIPIPEFIGSIKQLQHLNLWNSNFSGIVPPQLGNLTNLEILNLADNQLNGSMPDLRAFSSLTELHLRANNFTGSIPLSIGQHSKLQILDLSKNSLEGLVSEAHFIKLDKLNFLDLSFNSLILAITTDWSPPFQLDSISLARCNVGPYFPNWLRTQRNFSYLDLSGANITDEAPRWLWSTSSRLLDLYLSDNKISGTIPNLSSTSILYMDLSNNQFSGPIPLFPPNVSDIQLSGNMLSGPISFICKTRHYWLWGLDLSNNQLEGEIPNCWEKIPYLYSLNLANNSFSGEIPISFGNLKDLLSLQMHDNNISGDLRNLRLCQSLILIDVGGNELRGEIPTWIGHMYKLRILNFRGNKLHGSIPPRICNLANIQVLDFSINNLSSIIPDCFNNFTLFATKNTTYFQPFYFWEDTNEKKQYEHSSFQWKGQESQYRENLWLLKLIDFSSNRLTGNIPKSFSNMSGLISLNLSRNSLTGYIIPDIGKMEMLDSLDLSHNQLSGKIPTSLAQIYTLGVLDLSNNKLYGRIPTSTQLQSFNASAYAGNDGLCGDPLAKCPDDRLRPSTTDPGENMNEKDGSSLSFMREVGISMGFGFIIGFWGVVGSFIVKKSWRIAFFNLVDAAGDWFYVRIAVFVSKLRRS